MKDKCLYMCNLGWMSAFCLSVCPSVFLATTFQGVDRSCSFMAQSIAYDPRAWTKEGIFLKLILAPTRGVRSLNSIHFHMKIRFYWYLRRLWVWCWTGWGGGQNCPADPKIYPLIDLYPSDRFIPSDQWKYACQSPSDGFLHFLAISEKWLLENTFYKATLLKDILVGQTDRQSRKSKSCFYILSLFLIIKLIVSVFFFKFCWLTHFSSVEWKIWSHHQR